MIGPAETDREGESVFAGSLAGRRTPAYADGRAPRRRHRLLGLAVLGVAALGALGLTACHPTAAETALRLTVLDSAVAQTPAANVTVSLYPADDPDASPVATGSTRADGNVWFTHDRLGAGDYVIMFGSQPFVVDGSPVPGSDTARWYNGTTADAATDRSGAATITVVDDAPTHLIESYRVPRGGIDHEIFDTGHHPLEGVTVTAYAWPSGKAVAHVTSGGTDRLDGLPAQNYKLGFTKPGYATVFAAAPGSTDGTTYHLADAAEFPALPAGGVGPGAEVTMRAEAKLTGTVTTPDGSPLAGVAVAAYLDDAGTPVASSGTAPNGTFTISGLGDAGYHLVMFPPNGNLLQTKILGAGRSLDPDDGTTLLLRSGATTSLGAISFGEGADCAAARGGAKDLGNADLRSCDLTDAELWGAELSGADLSGAALTHAGISASMAGTVLRGANLSQATVGTAWYADLRLADLSHANLSSFDGVDIDISGANLSSAALSGARSLKWQWDAATTVPAEYRLVADVVVGPGIDASSANLSNQDLSGMDLSSASLSSIDLTNASLVGVDLSDARLMGVDLSGADLTDATLWGVWSVDLVADASTVLPDGWEITDGKLRQT